MFERLGGIAIALAAYVALYGEPAMSQDNMDSHFRKDVEDHYPFIEQNAVPPGHWKPYGGTQVWTGQTGWRTRHGDAVVMWSLGNPERVWNARLADGTLIDAFATMGSPSPWRYRAPGEPRRWIHGSIEINSDRVIFTPGQQLTYEPAAAGDTPDLQVALARQEAFRHRLVDERFADMLHAYLSNGHFWKEGGERIWLIGSRSAARIVANLRGHGDTYIDYFLNDGQGPVTEAMREWRRSLGQPEMSPEEAAVQEQKLAWFEEIREVLQALGWRRATDEDKAVAAAFTRRDIALWELRPEGPVPAWAGRMLEPRVEGVVYVRTDLREAMTEQQRREFEELAGGLFEKRLYRLAMSGRISESEWQSMVARILSIPRNFVRG